MNSKNAKDIRKQLRNVVQEQIEEVLQREVFAKMKEQIEAELRIVFGARLESINDSILGQLKSMDERAKDVQQFILNQATAELARTAPSIQLDQNAPESTTLATSE